MEKCPNCKKYTAHKSRSRSFLEKTLLPLILLRIFRCSPCKKRFYRFKLKPARRKPKRFSREDQSQANPLNTALPKERLDFEALVLEVRESEEQLKVSKETDLRAFRFLRAGQVPPRSRSTSRQPMPRVPVPSAFITASLAANLTAS